MTPAALVTLFRSRMRDEATPYLWSDADVYSYIDDAQKMFCRLTNGISDATTSAVVDITVAQNAEWLTLHPAVLKIRGATRTSDAMELKVLNYEDLGPRQLRLDGRVGVLTGFIVGMEEGKLRLLEKASKADAIKLLVFRLPLATLSGAGGEVFEIDAIHHLHLMDWAGAMAYLKQDAETFDKSKSEELETRFRAYCAQAKREQDMKRHKVRTVAYGGI